MPILTNLAASTLPNRYNRIKVNMMRMNDGDVSPPLSPSMFATSSANHPPNKQDQHLLLAKKEIEDAYNSGFWANIAANMERRGAGKYPSAFLQKTFKELEAAGKMAINPVNGAAVNGAEEEDVEAIKEEDTGEGGDDA